MLGLFGGPALAEIDMRVKITKRYKVHQPGDILIVSPNVGFGLIDAGVAEVTKDITEGDTRRKRGRARG